WLVNALAYETTFTMRAGRDRTQPITAEMIQQAKENLILRRETHLDQLTDKLREPRVRRVIEALLVSGETPLELPDDDLQYVADLGLIRRTPNVVIANPIYREIIPRALTSVTQDFIVQELAWYIRSDGQLDLPKLLAAFQQFFREHSESWVERFDYKEAGPQLLLQAFLQRIVNGGGRVEREYGLGRKRTDLLVLWPVAEPGVEGKEHVQRGVIELKVLHKSLEATLAEGVVQTWEYADRCGAAEAHLVIFDRTPDKPWEEKIFRREEAIQGRPITVWGM
ncbi:MAG: ATP-binding protein, partial [Anaerolineae bacterium]